MLNWLPGARVHDLHPAIGNGPFQRFLGVVLHVNVAEHGTPASFWGNGNPGQVCPNFQVFKDGSIDQMLPLNWQPWCQVEGNFHYAAIETAGLPNEPLTGPQLHACARIVRAYHDELGMQLKIANAPGEPGFGTHGMGGAAWGGHTGCPGPLRAGQRREILALAMPTATTPPPKPPPPPARKPPPPPAPKPLEYFYADRAAYEAAVQHAARAAVDDALRVALPTLADSIVNRIAALIGKGTP